MPDESWSNVRRDFCLKIVDRLFLRSGRTGVSANDGRINHQIFQIAVSREMLKEFFKDTDCAPPIKAFVNRVPIAVTGRQKPPLRSRTGNPENGFEKLAALGFLSDINVRAGFQK